MKVKKIAAVAAATGGLALAGTGAAFALDGGSIAEAAVMGSPGVVTGNTVQVPVHIPVNLCGTTVNVIAALNPVFGTPCATV
jgi:hypothetical protein